MQEYPPQGRNDSDRSGRLRSGLLYLLAWLFVAGIEYRLFVDSGGIHELLSDTLEQPMPILLLAVSIVLLALAIRDLSSWLRRNYGSNDRSI